MLPSRGLQPTHFAQLTSRQSTAIQSNASRKFSSLPRTAGLTTRPSRTSALQSSGWRAGVASNSHVALNASSVRFGSWYAPWSWGKSSTGTETVAVAEFSNQHPQPTAAPSESAVTSSTPELAPGGIDKAAVTENAINPVAETYTSLSSPETFDGKTVEDVLSADPVKTEAGIDPTQLIDHAGQLRELGLDYGWGMTTTIEKLIETIYLQSGWGWAGSIMATTLAVRFGMFFLQALSSDKMAAMAAMKPVTQPIQEKLDAAIARGDNQQVQLLRMQQAQVMKPFIGGSVAMFGLMGVQMWVGISAFRLLRAMGDLPVPGMTKDGFLWFGDLSTHDPYYLLPITTSAIMYTIFKKGGETGVQNDVGAAGMTGARSVMMSGLALGMGVFTCWQPAALQLYFLTSGVLGGATGLLLRQNGFRRMIGIKTLPTPESHELFTKVAKGELKLKDIKDTDGKIRYQAPRVTSSSSPTTRGIKIKAGAAMPAHLKPEAPKVEAGPKDRDHDYEEGAKGSIGERLSYYRRNYRLAYVQRRFAKGAKNMMRRAGYGGAERTPEQERRKRRAEQYEIERRRRFENRN